MAALDERPKVEARAYRAPAPVPVGSNRPGDAYNAATDPAAYLIARGWKVDHVRGDVTYLTRPGKGDGVSASVGRCKTGAGLPRVYVFTSSAAPLEPGESYDAFGLYAQLECGGDRVEAARRLGDKGFGDQAVEVNWSGGRKAAPAAGQAGKPAGKAAAIPPWVPFPTDALPDTLARYVRESAAAIGPGYEDAAVAAPLLAVLAGIIGNRRRVVAKRGFAPQPACLWCATVGLSGTMKSPGWKAADRLANDLDRAIEDASADERREWHRRQEAGGEPGPKPPSEKLVVEDITIESVGATLADNPSGLLVSMDELSVWFDLFTRYRKGGGSDANRWIGLWEGGRLKINRKGPGGDFYIPQALVSVAGTIQPAILARACNENERESGFLSRLLLIYPPGIQKIWTEAEPSLAAWQDMATLAGRLHAMEPFDVGLTPDAKAAFRDHYNALGAAEFVELDEDRRTAMAKAPRLVLRLAVIHHCVNLAAGLGPIPDDPIGVDSIGFGIVVADWFLNELRRVYRVMLATKDDALTQQVLEWGRRKGGRFTVRELLKARRDRFAKADDARQFLDGLAEAGLGTWQGDRTFALATVVYSDDDESDGE
jgi:hypothetical protein